jgi:hypothetical protein
MLDSLKTHLLHICLATLLLLFAANAYAQGCSMCRDTTAGSAPQIRAGLRRAIPVLAVPAIAIFIGFFLVARRTDLWHQEASDAKRQSVNDQP